MKKFFIVALSFVSILTVLLAAYQPAAEAAFNQNLLIDDTVFNDSGSMNAEQINNFLNVFGNSCISRNSGFEAREPTGYSPGGGFTYGNFVSAGQVIHVAATVYGLNPQVLLATLQKEQSLTAGSGASYCNDGDEHKYAAATGYGCNDGGAVHSWTGVSLYRRGGVERTSTGSTCVASAATAGFSQQVIRAAWLLKFGQQRALGNTGWAVVSGSWDNSDDPPTGYGGPMTQGTLQRSQGSAPAYYDGYTTIDSTAVHMDSGATAALYWYTPHFHGNQNFVSLFESWFGSTVSAGYYSCKSSSNVPGAITGEHVIGSKLGINHTDNLRLMIPNNTGSSCVEAHTWQNNNYNAWMQHIASNSPAVNPSSQKVLSLDGNGDGIDELYKIDYSGTGSGMIEVHVWDELLRRWVSHTATNRPNISLADSEVVAANTTGGGPDSLFLVQYRNTSSGQVEIHQWSGNMQQWVSHIATNYGQIDPAGGQVITADLSPVDGKDEFYLVNYAGSSGRIEVHGWSSNFQQWISHTATVSPAATHVDGSGNSIVDIIAADTNGNAQDELYKVDYRGTNSARVEIHGFTSNFQQWVSHTATNQGSF